MTVETAALEPPKSANVAVRDDMKLILDRVRDAVREIEISVEEIDDLLIELYGLEDLPEDVADLADSFRDEAGTLAEALGNHFERLCKEIAAAVAAGDED